MHDCQNDKVKSNSNIVSKKQKMEQNKINLLFIIDKKKHINMLITDFINTSSFHSIRFYFLSYNSLFFKNFTLNSQKVNLGKIKSDFKV